MLSNIGTTCRACLAVSLPAHMTSLADPQNRALFAECTSIRVPPPETDLLPQQLCEQCYHQCQLWTNFRLIAQENDLQLNNIMSTGRAVIETISLEVKVPMEEMQIEDPLVNIPDDELVEEVLIEEVLDDDLVEEHILVEEEQPQSVNIIAKAIWQCQNCELGFGLVQELRAHLKERHLEDNTCSLCTEEPFPTIEKAIEHYIQIHVKKLACAACPMRFKSHESLLAHIKKKHDGDESLHEGVKALTNSSKRIVNKTLGPITCALCDYSADEFRAYEVHFRWRHGSDLVCALCGEVATNNLQYLDHVYLHHMECRFECHMCGFEAASTLAVKKHQYEEHPTSRLQREYGKTLENFVCEVCGKAFHSRHAVLMHAEYHKEGTPCKICGKKIKGYTTMKLHMHRHNKKKIFRCDHCPKSFTTGQYLQVHRKRHFEDQKKFVCDVCGSRFFSSSNLKNHHKARHTRQRF